MLDHVKLFVGDLPRSRAFYARALRPLGWRVMIERDDREVAFGAQFPHFWIDASAPGSGAVEVAFVAPDRDTVDAFRAAALAAGGEDAGAPAGGYAAAVRDPDGHVIVAVCAGG